MLPSGNIQVFCKVNGKFYQQVFAPTSKVSDRNAWRDRTIEANGGGPTAAAGSFAADCVTYLRRPEVAARKYIGQVAKNLELWLDALGRDRPRRTITRDEVETVLQRWLAAGFAQPTVYHRRTALRSLFSTLDGKNQPNPVTETTRPAHYRPVDRSVDHDTIRRILAAMPDDRAVSAGIRQPSLSKLRATVIAYTGIPPAELMKLRRQDFDRDAGIVRMPWRDKGAGTPAHIRELSSFGVAAFVALDAARGWGAFAPERLSASFKRAARRVCGPDTAIRLYDLRHSLGAQIYRSTRDLATVGRLLGHAPGSIVTSRYAMGAHAEVDRAAMAAVTAAWEATPAKPAATAPTPLQTRLHGVPKLRKKTTSVASV
jgi:integrase